jgi:hypothetical protein
MVTRNGPLETPAPRLECAGFTIGDFSVPPFNVRAGQALCVHIPPALTAGREELLAILTGRVGHAALRFFGSVGRLDRPMPWRRWWGGLFDPPVRNWLIGERGLTPEEAAGVLDRVALPATLRIGRVGWNERTLLALEACLLHPPDLLIFDTAGNDPLGVQRVFERLVSRPPSLALAYMKTAWGVDEPCLPGAACLAVACRSLQTTAVE